VSTADAVNWQLADFGGDKLLIRPDSTDRHVAHSCLVDREFEAIVLDRVQAVFDCGANIGASTVAFSTRFPNATVIAVEPEQDNFALLEANTLGRSNVKRIQAAVAATPGPRMILDPCIGAWGYTTVDSPRHLQPLGQVVPGLTIDGLMDHFGVAQVDILKLDVEGAEKEVFESPGIWIDRVRAIVVELHDRYLPGCTEAFQHATAQFSHRVLSGEKWIAYR
jgi:FkbM family methyltransferase